MTAFHSAAGLSEQLRLKQRSAWLRGERPLVETYLAEHPELVQDDDGLLDLIYNEYCLREECGSEPTLDEFQRRFPQYVERLRPLLVLHQAMKSAAPETRLGSQPASTLDRPVPDSHRADPQGETPRAGILDPSTGRLEVRCPTCHAPTAVAVDTQLTELTCGSCGSQFRLVDPGRVPRTPPSLSKMGRFELVEQLGVGGFGSVWKARDKQLDRMVAIKIPRASAITAEEQEKFFREARAAAQLRHPSIVSVHEVGRDGDSVYIVSDFVHGVTLGDWLIARKPTSREAAELCTEIADALHHAHEQGVVHRDLKPANVMIDAAGQPHIMDFGLARREVGEVTITVDGYLVGTPAYMSPEQAQGKSHDADRRSDAYSLGVILFQLLTGELPFRGSVEMLLYQVVTEEPPSPRKLNGRVPKDLETITLKCLEKSPDRRYQSAKELADELRRFSRGEPIHARPISRPERAVRWVRRNKTVAALSAIAISALIGGIVASSLFAIGERRQAVIADDARRDALERQKEAESERASAEAMVNFLIKDVLGKANPRNMPEKAVRDTLVNALIEPAAATVGQRFAEKPLIESAIRNVLAMTLRSLGRYDLALIHAEKALEQRRKVLGDEHPITIQSLDNYAFVLGSLGRAREAEPLHKQALEQHRKVLGEDHPDTLASLNNYATVLMYLGRAQEAEPLMKRTVERCRAVLGEDHADTVQSLGNYAYVLEMLGQSQQAEPLLKQALAQRRKLLGEKHPDTIESLDNYAFVLVSLGRLQEAEPLHRQALEHYREMLGNDHPDTMASLDNYAYVLRSLGRAREAEPLHKQALEQYRKVLGADHPDTIMSLQNYADVLQALDRTKEAEPLLKQVLAQRRKVLGEDHPDTIASLHKYAHMLDSLGQRQEAEPLFMQALEQHRKVFGDDDPRTITSLNNYAAVLPSLDAEPLFKQALEQRQRLLGADHPDTILSLHNYADVLDTLGRFHEAEPLYEQALERCSRVLGEGHTLTFNTMNKLARILATSPLDEIRDGKRAVELATEACDLTQYKNAFIVATLAAACAETGDFESAEKWAERALELLGEGGSVELREQFSQALAKYKDKNPMRQEIPPPKAEADATPAEQPTGAQPSAASSNDSASSSNAVPGQK